MTPEEDHFGLEEHQMFGLRGSDEVLGLLKGDALGQLGLVENESEWFSIEERFQIGFAQRRAAEVGVSSVEQNPEGTSLVVLRGHQTQNAACSDVLFVAKEGNDRRRDYVSRHS